MTNAYYSDKPFARTLAELLREEQQDPLGRVKLREFFNRVDGWTYEHLRRMVVGERTLQPEAIEAMARPLGVPPEYFLEYRRHCLCELVEDAPHLTDDLYWITLLSNGTLDTRVREARTEATEVVVRELEALLEELLQHSKTLAAAIAADGAAHAVSGGEGRVPAQVPQPEAAGTPLRQRRISTEWTEGPGPEDGDS